MWCSVPCLGFEVASPPSPLSPQVGFLFFVSIFWGFFPLFTAIFTFPQVRTSLCQSHAAPQLFLPAAGPCSCAVLSTPSPTPSLVSSLCFS